MIAVENTYSLIGALFAAFAVLSLHRDGPRRWLAALFWLLLTISMWFGGRLGDVGNGVLALALAVIAAFGAPGAARA
ncbi:MAG TPA: DUF979 family protein, partial [Caulobacter sp.]|nr:DUF979 family protein [Caulobacter sp.]